MMSDPEDLTASERAELDRAESWREPEGRSNYERWRASWPAWVAWPDWSQLPRLDRLRFLPRLRLPRVPCVLCLTSGTLAGDVCPLCEGTGRVPPDPARLDPGVNRWAGR
jgi:hypothetical protein